MTVLRGRKAHRSLLKKGFEEERDTKHIFYYYYYNGKKTDIFTHMSHNPGDLDNYLIDRMADQTKLTKEEFIDLVKCSFDKETLLETYIGRKYLP